jgi:hypothetical protein
MKRLTLRRNRRDEAMKRLTMLKNNIYVHAEITKKQGKTLPHICKGKDDDVFWLCY